MREQLFLWLSTHNYPHSPIIINSIMVVLIILTTLVLHYLIHAVVFRFLIKRFQNANSAFLQLLQQQRFLGHLAFAIQGMLLALQLQLWLPESGWRDGLITVTRIWTLIYSLLALMSLLNVVQEYLFRKNIARQFPVRGLVQTLKLVLSIAFGIFIISLLLGQSPLLLLSGLGAMTAVLMLVFKDPIMGLVAGIQLSANRMLQIGDWLEMPKYNADGDVIDIGLTTVKVRNFDNTITSLPTYALISDSFKNWRGMSESGGRRIKRSVFIDTTSVHFLSSDEISRLQHSRLLTDYLQQRQQEISQYNQEHHAGDNALDRRSLTNIGTFRAYLQQYLQAHPRIRQDMTIMVRQLAAQQHGIPLEIYCFTNTVAWGEYEAIQADIFDHIYAVATQFDLRLYQAPSGYDMRMLGDGRRTDSIVADSPSSND